VRDPDTTWFGYFKYDVSPQGIVAQLSFILFQSSRHPRFGAKECPLLQRYIPATVTIDCSLRIRQFRRQRARPLSVYNDQTNIVLSAVWELDVDHGRDFGLSMP